MAGFLLHHRPASCLAVSGRTRFLDAGYDRVVPVTHMDQAVCDELPPPWRNPAPEKRWCRRGVRAKITDPWLAFPRPVPNWLTRQTTRYNNTATTQVVTAGPPLRPLGSRPVPNRGWPAVTKLKRNSASHRRAVPLSTRGNSRAPACAPAPWSPPRYWSWLSSARRSAAPRRCSDGRSLPPR